MSPKLGEEGTSPSTVISAPPFPSPALLPTASVDCEPFTPAAGFTLSEPRRVSFSTLRAFGFTAILATALVSYRMTHPSKEPTPPPLPHARRRCIDPVTCWTLVSILTER